MSAPLHVVGVRHHSPACARLVAETIAEVDPDVVLVEGPADFNDRIDELRLAHRPPIALFSFAHGDGIRHASWSPFCAYSPEWVALRSGGERRATFFIDLPAWSDAFAAVENRYSDRTAKSLDALAARFGVETTDALWDHLFEQPLAAGALRERLGAYFAELRASDEPASESDLAREAYMARWIAWARARAERAVMVVCGGYHAPALERVGGDASAERPAAPERAGIARAGTYLVPYSFHRLDAFVGYEAGMPSPAFYQRVWERGADAAGEDMLFAAVAHLRKRKQRVSPADAIAALTLARGLRTLRGREALAREDVLDGLAASLVKDALDAPLPWSRRGTIQRGTAPLLVEIVAAFSGDAVGELAKGTPHPPLVADAFAELVRVGVVLERAGRTLAVDLSAPEERERSRVLHRLRVLAIPGVALARRRSVLVEEWSVARSLDAEAALIEAAAWGASLESAAAARLEDHAAGARGMAALVRVLEAAARIGIDALALRVAAEVRAAIDVERSFADLGAGLAALVALHAHDVLFGAEGAPLIGAAIAAAYERGLWLCEGVAGAAGEGEIRAVLALRDALARRGASLGLDPALAEAVMARRAVDPDAPAALRGAAFGFGARSESVVAAVGRMGRPETLGDFLAGLFALAREEMGRSEELLRVVDDLVGRMDRADFLRAIPSLRMAFEWFPPREKEAIARAVLSLHSLRSPLSLSLETPARSLTRLDVSAAVVVRGLEVDAAVTALARRYGLGDGAES
ncbi:MAG: hypothetical protein KIT84_19825 [Labilithrix sp.]|nr:hypothetical protein [Labilithrix sp.]MCW5813287.1 hypothetical protein [Labilithrix sp.]